MSVFFFYLEESRKRVLKRLLTVPRKAVPQAGRKGKRRRGRRIADGRSSWATAVRTQKQGSELSSLRPLWGNTLSWRTSFSTATPWALLKDVTRRDYGVSCNDYKIYTSRCFPQWHHRSRMCYPSSREKLGCGDSQTLCIAQWGLICNMSSFKGPRNRNCPRFPRLS